VLASRDTGELRDLETTLFSGGYRVVTARTAHEALEKTHAHAPDAIVLDRELTGPSFSLCENLRADPALSPAAPILIAQLQPSTSDERLDALRAGAWYLIGDARLAEELLAHLNAFLQAKLEVDRLTSECLIDRPSGLYNHAGFAQRAHELTALTDRQGLPTTCVVFRPAPLPDKPTGDRLGQIFKEVGRLSDAIGRTGSAEFAVFAPATTSWAATQLIQRVSAQVGKQLRVTLRAAFSSALPSQKIPPTLLLERARASLETRRI
jgi:CheY-like chemotaxis protein